MVFGLSQIKKLPYTAPFIPKNFNVFLFIGTAFHNLRLPKKEASPLRLSVN